MNLDDEVCLCFHVTRRKLQNYIRIEKPRRAAQLSDCYGAGTGCGWCRPYLVKLFAAAQARDEPASDSAKIDLPTAENYASGRRQHIDDGHGTPPPSK